MEDFEIKIGEEIQDDLPLDEPPLTRGKYKAWGKPEQDQVRIIFGQKAYKQVCEHARSEPRREVGGVLLGRAYRHEGITYSQVTEVVSAVLTRSSSSHLTFTADTWSAVNRRQRAEFPDSRILGWYHTHPRMDVFLSADDSFLHESFFPKPWQIALVIEPHKHYGGFFAWKDSSVRPVSGFYELLDVSNKSIVNWRNMFGPSSPPVRQNWPWMQWMTLAVLVLFVAGVCGLSFRAYASLNSIQQDLSALEATVRVVGSQTDQIGRQIAKATAAAQGSAATQTASIRATEEAQAAEAAVATAVAATQTVVAQETRAALDVSATQAAHSALTATATVISSTQATSVVVMSPTAEAALEGEAPLILSRGLDAKWRGKLLSDGVMVPPNASIEIHFAVSNPGALPVSVTSLGVRLAYKGHVFYQWLRPNGALEFLPGEESPFVLDLALPMAGELSASVVIQLAELGAPIDLPASEGYRSLVVLVVR